MDRKLFAETGKRNKPGTDNFFGVTNERPGVKNLNTGDGFTGEAGLEEKSDNFNFGKLGHKSITNY
jgi:hypothetical protein